MVIIDFNLGKTEIPSFQKEFTALISQLALNDEYLAILSEGRVHFIQLSNDSIEKIFPLKDTDDQIYSVAITDNFLIYSDSNNRIKIFNFADNYGIVSDYRFPNIIKKIFVNVDGTKIICIDNLGKACLYNPVNESNIQLNNENEYVSASWDIKDPNIFIVLSRNNIVFKI